MESEIIILKTYLLILLTGMMFSSFCLSQAMFVDEGNSIGLYRSFESESNSDGITNAITIGGV